MILLPGTYVSLDDIRMRLDDIDREILRLLAARRDSVRDVAATKVRDNLALRHPGREQELLLRAIRHGRTLGLSAPFVMQVFRAIIGDSVRLQHEELQRLMSDEAATGLLRGAFLGSEGSFSHVAMRAFAMGRGQRLSPVPAERFRAVTAAVEEGRADIGALPIENSTSGGINEVYDLIMHTRLAIVGEQRMPIVHCLCTREGVSLDDVEVVYSHPQPAAQCSEFLEQLGVRVEVSSDTAAAAARVSSSDTMCAAIASAEAAEIHGLMVLEDEIANSVGNSTRFLFVAREREPIDARIPCKTSLVMSTAQRPGALVDALLVFRDAGLTLTKLESRPVPANTWEEM
ncbi:MAG: chorismate mutase/prephenate dehydratase, partial [Bradymonadia bacterium]